MSILILQRLFFEALADLFYFPFWWYSKGVLHAAKWCFNLLKSGNERLAPALWLKNIFVPMFGQYDLQGRLVSFFMRLMQVIVRLIALLFWLIVCVLLFLGWLLLPIATIYGLVYSQKTIS